MKLHVFDRPRSGARIVLFALVLLIIGIAIGTVAGETEYEDQYSLEHPGEAKDIVPNDDVQIITDIYIYDSQKDTQSSQNVSLYINTSDVTDDGIDMSSVNLRSVNISNGNLISTETTNIKDKSYIKIDINYRDTSERLTIHQIEIENFGAKQTELSPQFRYEFFVTESETEPDLSNLNSDDHTADSDDFKIASGLFQVPDQATESSRFLNDDSTSASVSMRNFTSSVNSTIVITREKDEELEVVGVRPYTNTTSASQEISTETLIAGGKIRAHLIPSSYLSSDEVAVGDIISNSTVNPAIANDSAKIMLGVINFEDIQSESKITSNITISNARLRDETTPFVVSLHPIMGSGKLNQSYSFGHSRVLTGRNSNVELSLKNGSQSKSKIQHTNRFGALMHIAEGHNEGEIVELNSTEVIPNSDIDEQFVENGVADNGTIFVSERVKNTSEEEISHILNETESIQHRVYAGSTMAIGSEDYEPSTYEMHRVRSENKSEILGIGNPILNGTYSVFDTTNLDSGEYYILNSESENQIGFRIVGKGDQYINTHAHSKESAVGSRLNFNIEHNTRNASLAVSNTTNQSTVATVNLTTTGNETIPTTINTYAAGDPDLTDEFITVGEGGTVESVEVATSDGTLSPGTYELAVRSTHGSVTTADNATFTVQSRSTDDMTVYTTDAHDPDAFDTAADVREAIDADALSSSTTASDSETIVYAVDATGLSGLPTAQNATLEVGPDVDRVGGFDFGIRSAGATEEDQMAAGSETLRSAADETDDLGPTPKDATVHLDEGGLYLIAAGEDAFPTTDEPDPGEEFTAAFRVDDDRLRSAADPEDDHTVTADLSYVDTDAASDPVDGGNGAASGPGGGGGSGGSVTAGPTEDVRGASGATDRTPEAGEGGDRASDLAMTGGGSRVRPVPELGAPHRNYGAPRGSHTGAAEDRAESADRGGTVTADESTADTGASTDTGPTAEREAVDGGNTSADRFAEPDAPDYENAPIRSTAYDIPGFGPVVAVFAIASLARLAARRQ